MTRPRWVSALLAALLLGPPAAKAELLIPCLSSDQCPSGLLCNWGLCEDSLLVRPTLLFQVSVLDIPDLAGLSGTLRIRDAMAVALVESLSRTLLFRAIRHSGAYPVDTGTLFSAANRGSAYAISAAVVQFDGTAGRLGLSMVDVETGRPVEALAPEVEFRADDPEAAVESWINALVLQFTGRPGILGVRIACVRRMERGVKEVFVFTFGRTDMRQVTRDGTLNLMPSWTVDGRVAYISYKRDAQMIFLDGREEPFSAFEGMNSGITWSRDGALAALTLSKDGNPEIYLLEGATGEELARLTYEPGIDTSPSWSPDGKEMAFVSDRDGTPQLWVMNADGGAKRRLTWSGIYNTSPDWHPFGPYLAYTARTGGTFQVFRFDLRSGESRQLTFGPGDCEDPDWSPDGRLIAFAWNRGRRQDICVMNPDGSQVRRLTEDEGPYYAPAWEMSAPPTSSRSGGIGE